MTHTKGGSAPRPPCLEQLRQETPLSGKEEEEVRKAATLSTNPRRPRLTRKQKEEGSWSLNHSSRDLLRKEKWTPAPKVFFSPAVSGSSLCWGKPHGRAFLQMQTRGSDLRVPTARLSVLSAE